jgi:hypothetical protein
MDYFTNLLLESGYKRVGDDGFVKDSLKINVKPLKSGKATLFIADLTAEMKQMQRVVYQQKMQKPTGQEPLPLLQQAILAEERDTTAKPPKDPQRHWVGRKKGRATILGWEQ